MVVRGKIEKSQADKSKRKKYRKDIILRALVEEYTRTGEPVASEVLNARYRLGVSSATIRNHFVFLTENGYLFKPYISSGRIPTDKAWKFFVKVIFDDEENVLSRWEAKFSSQFLKIGLESSVNSQSSATKIKKLVGLVSEESHTLCFCYLFQENELIKQGLKYMFQGLAAEELLSLKLLQKIAESLEQLDQKLKNIEITQPPLVLIGKDNPLIKSDQFSSLLTSLSRPKAILGILGSKRMPYDKNIAILKTLTNLIN
ncbi:MAG: hypothetical protein PHF45_01835 [Candidatus Pacebacteria bacterium]|nr:hypothetical protein [Candidatus Paceibacterota bacterium]